MSKATKKIISILGLILSFVILRPIDVINADETCDQAGESCCTAGLEHYCDNASLTCNKELNPNDDPSLQYDTYIFICRIKEDVTDTTTCNEVGEKCCKSIISDQFCVNNLICDSFKGYTCQELQTDDIDYSACSISGNSCCRSRLPGYGMIKQNYCAPELTMIETSGVCKCCSPGDDDCQANTNTLPTFSLCDNLTEGSDQRETCDTCLANDGVWTGLGCFRFTPTEFITDFLKIAIGIAGGIALLLMIYGSFLISTSAGDPKKSEEGKEIITGTIAGLLFIIFSVFLLRLIGVEILNIPGF